MHSLTLGGRELTLSLLFVFTKVIHTGYPPFACGRWHMGDEDAESEGAVETFGALRLLLKSGTASGYVGVRRVKKSKKRPWQGWVHLKGEKRRCLGSFRTPQEAAVARARALACRTAWRVCREPKEAGCTQLRCCCALSATLMFPFALSTHLILSRFRVSESPSRVVCTVKRLADNALTPDTLINENVPKQQFVAGGSVPRGAAGALAASCAYTPPYRAFNIQTLPSRCCPASLLCPRVCGTAAFGMALPAQQPQQ